jgi:hypothetical protein
MASTNKYGSITELLEETSLLFPASLFAKKNVPWIPVPAIDVSIAGVSGKQFIDSKGKVTYGLIWTDEIGRAHV